MRTHYEQAGMLVGSILAQAEQLRIAGVPAERTFEACLPGVQALLAQFQDELLEEQRQAGVALAQALNMAGGKSG